MSPPRIGVVIPAYNAAIDLPATLSSVAGQDHVDLECVIVDDGSTDQTLEVAMAFARTDPRFTVVSQPNAGVGTARNRGMGLLASSPDYLTFMDADDVWRPDALSKLVRAAESGDFIGAHGLAEFIDASGAPLLPGEFPRLGRDRKIAPRGWPRAHSLNSPTCFESVLIASTMFPPGLMIVRAEIYKCIGGFDNRVRPADDWDALIRITRHGDIAFVNEVILDYRRHESNAGASSIVPERCRQVRVKAHHSPENSVEHNRIARRAFVAAQIVDLSETWTRMRSSLARRQFKDAAACLARLPIRVGRIVRRSPRLRRGDVLLIEESMGPAAEPNSAPTTYTD